MSNEVVAGFWSYAHDDNRLDGGAILELARLIKEEYDLLSGEPLELFVDRDSIAWGQEWRERIDSSLTQTTFFIPIITPRYFLRPECRRELLEFAAKAKSLGVIELLLPIVYVETQGLSSESSDEAVALVASTQYVDWRAARLLEPESRDYRSRVNSLARRLLEVGQRVAEVQLDRELNVDISDDEADGIADITERIEALLPEWLEAVMGDQTNDVQMTATMNQGMGKIEKLRKANAPASAILAARIRLAREILPLTERGQKEARTYLSRSLELDPLISELARLINSHPESSSLAMPTREAINEAITAMQKREQKKELRKKGFLQETRETFFEMRHLGRIFQKCYTLLNDIFEKVDEGNEIVKRWDDELGISAR